MNSFMKIKTGNFSILNKLTNNSLAFRMTKYDPTKELEVIKKKFILETQSSSILGILRSQTV